MGRLDAIEPLPRMVSDTAAGSLPHSLSRRCAKAILRASAAAEKDHGRRTENPGYIPGKRRSWARGATSPRGATGDG